MIKTVGLILGGLTTITVGCSSAFSGTDDCHETRTCKPKPVEAGAGGEGFGGSAGEIGGNSGSGGDGIIVAGAGGDAQEPTCTPDTTESCYASADGTPYQGEPAADQTTCRLGERKCQSDGTWGACIGAVAPEADDTCDPGNDANCNGTPNEGCVCKDGEKRACGSDTGNCAKGEQTCKDQAWGECVGEVTAQATDSCDEGDDANCNGTPNEGCGCVNGTTKTCGTDIGPCELGSVTCVNGAFPDTCEGGIKPAAADTCAPGNDANCNGTPNEGCSCTGSGQTDCGVDTGACTKGKQTCTDGTLGMCLGGVSPTTNDTCFAANEANDTNCNGKFRDGCTCVATDAPNPCGDAGCGEQTCNGGTGKWNACKGDGSTLRCNPSSPDTRQVCGTNGAWTASACPSGSVCRDDGECKKIDGQSCTTSADCATSACTTFYVDADKDGYRVNATAVKFCGDSKTGYVTSGANKGTDCNDAAAAVNLGATEICDGIDNDCDKAIDLNDVGSGLKLSGTEKVIATGGYSAVASSGADYGVSYSNGNTGKTYFLTLSQANSVQLMETDVDNGVGATTIAWGGDAFGLVYKVGNQTYFRKVTAAGAFSPASPVLLKALSSSPNDPGLARLNGSNWLHVASGGAGGTAWVRGITISSSNVPANSESKYEDTAIGGRVPGLAASGTKFGLTWLDAGSKSAWFSILDASGAVAVAAKKLKDTGTSGRSPVIAPRVNGGFAILFGEGDTLYFEEFSVTGVSQCERVSKVFSDFDPDQMVPTKNGYLAVSAYNNVVKAQEILSGCTFGTSFPNVGTSVLDSQAHIAAGANGFAVVWDGGSIVKSRTFGSNLCD